MGTMDDAAEGRITQSGIPEHHMMPLILIGESLVFRLLTSIIPVLGPHCEYRSGFLTAGRPWL